MSYAIQMRDRDGVAWTRFFLRWERARSHVGFIETTRGGTWGQTDKPEGPALGCMVLYSRDQAVALLAKAKTSGQLAGLVDRCEVRPVRMTHSLLHRDGSRTGLYRRGGIIYVGLADGSVCRVPSDDWDATRLAIESMASERFVWVALGATLVEGLDLSASADEVGP